MLRPKRRISKKELKQDELLEFLFNAEQFVRKNQKALIYAVIGVVVVVVVALMMINSRKKADLAAAALVGQAQAAFDQGNYQQVISDLDPTINTYKGTQSAGIGIFYLGSASYRLSKYDDAQKYFQQYLDNYDEDPVLSASASATLGAIAVNDSDYAAAVQHYKTAARRAPYKFLAEEYSLQAAKNAFRSGDLNSAKTLLTQLLSNEDLAASTKTSAEELLASVDVKLENK